MPDADSSAVPQDREAREALAEIEKELGGATVAREMVDPQQACATYRRIRPWLERALPWIERVSRQLAEAVRFLMGIADTLCPRA
ncbi:MAG TPA: hypothetical protein VF746_19840 [Longimicrobium sp.]|jgi:hypothetical protein